MASNTDISLRNKIIYEVYLRNHGKNGIFADLQLDLRRIRVLGADVIWLMPVHPIGQKNKKGPLGCPYSISDYREINPEYGSLGDFRQLVAEIHRQGMSLMIDVVYNHTSRDSQLLKDHPEWFCRRGNRICTKVEDWSDVFDLDYNNRELWDYLIAILKFWAEQEVDGFRCDVAPLIPLEFWLRARAEVAQVKKDLFRLAESIDYGFINDLRRKGFNVSSDSEMYQAFDLTYDYDSYPMFRKYLSGQAFLAQYLEELRRQEAIFPANYVKLRFLENHDQERAARLFPNLDTLKLWTAFLFFQKGATLIYAGQEALDQHTPSLFRRDPVDWTGMATDFSAYLAKLSQLKKDPIMSSGFYQIHNTTQNGVILASYEYKNRRRFGIFNVEGKIGHLEVGCQDGSYLNLLDGRKIFIEGNKITLTPEPLIFDLSEGAATAAD